MEGGWERKHEEMGKRDEVWGSAEGHPDLTCPISPSLEEEEGEAGNPCSKAGLAVDHIPTQNTAAPTTSLDQATVVPHNRLYREGWCPPGCQKPPGQVTLTYGCWVVTCLVLSPEAGRVVGCSEDNLVGMVVVGMTVVVEGEEGWIQRAEVMQGRVELSPPTQVHVQQTATHQVSRPQSTVYCPALSRVRCPSHCYCHTSDRGKRLSSGLEGS